MGAEELLRGTLDLLVLRTLTDGPMHGFAIARHIQETTRDALRIKEGSLYPALHRLEERGLVVAAWGASGRNRRARFYRLSRAGRRVLGEERGAWDRFAGAVASVLGPSRGGAR